MNYRPPDSFRFQGCFVFLFLSVSSLGRHFSLLQAVLRQAKAKAKQGLRYLLCAQPDASKPSHTFYILLQYQARPKPSRSQESSASRYPQVEKSTWDTVRDIPLPMKYENGKVQRKPQGQHHLFTAILPFWLLKDPDIYCNTFFIFFNLVLLPC